MPVAGAVLAAGWGIWEAARDPRDGLAGRFADFASGLLWPGLAIFLVTTALVWLAWKVELD